MYFFFHKILDLFWTHITISILQLVNNRNRWWVSINLLWQLVGDFKLMVRVRNMGMLDFWSVLVCANKPQHCSSPTERLKALGGRLRAVLGETKSHSAGISLPRRNADGMVTLQSHQSPLSTSFQVGGTQEICFLHGGQVSLVRMA